MAGKKKQTADSAPVIAPATDLAPTKPGKGQEVKFLRTHPNYAYWPGDVAELADEHVEFLTTGGFAELAKPAA